MKYLLIPKHLLVFWYPESLVVFLRIWKNTILLLEEDLAMTLMWRLLFVPLFHDATVIGRLLSFFFRGFRLFIGFFAVFVVTLFLLTLALGWFLLPVSAFIVSGDLGWILKIILFSGVVLFINHLTSHPHKKVWNVKKAGDLWSCSFVNKPDIALRKLLGHHRVKNLLGYLEQSPQNFVNFSDDQTENDVLAKVFELGRQLGVSYLNPEHFFVAKILLVPDSENKLAALNLKPRDLILAVEFFKLKEESWKIFWLWDDEFRVKHLKGVNRGWLGVPTPNLDLVTDDLTKEALKENITDFVGRNECVIQAINILSLEKGRNVVIVGESGSGRTTLVKYLAKLIIRGDAPDALATKRLVRLDLTKLLSGIKTQGELAERLKNIFEEVKFSGNIIVFVDEIENFGVGEVGSSFNLYSLITPFLESDSFQFISTADPASYSKTLEKEHSFARLFTKIELPPASKDESLEVLKRLAVDYERYKKVQTSVLAIEAVVELSSRFIHDRVLPDSAVRLFERCLGLAESGWVTKKSVEKVIQSQVHVPVGNVEGPKKKQLLNLEAIISQQVIDQDQAVAAVAKTLRRSATDLREQNRPIGSFLFVGPTGVGKTELAKTLAEVFFEGSGQFLRFDMSEYQGSDAVKRIIGNSEDEGLLSEAVRHNPYALVLLDEFEKADAKILTLFLQVLEEGRLTDSEGRVVDFTNTIIIATSNVGSLQIVDGLKQDKNWEDLQKLVDGEVLRVFRPELINRFDEVVLFKPLSTEGLQKIVRIKLAQLQKQLKGQGYVVEFGDSLVAELVKRGFDPALGARPLRRVIQDTLESRLSVLILEGKLPKGRVVSLGTELLA